MPGEKSSFQVKTVEDIRREETEKAEDRQIHKDEFSESVGYNTVLNNPLDPVATVMAQHVTNQIQELDNLDIN